MFRPPKCFLKNFVRSFISLLSLILDTHPSTSHTHSFWKKRSIFSSQKMSDKVSCEAFSPIKVLFFELKLNCESTWNSRKAERRNQTHNNYGTKIPTTIMSQSFIRIIFRLTSVYKTKLWWWS